MTTLSRLSGSARRLPVRWPAAAALAIVLAYCDGFWLTALQGAIGAAERAEPPFGRWLRDSTLMLPLVFLAVLLALLGARRWFARGRRRLAVAAALLVGLSSAGVGIAEAAASSLIDYQYQVRHLALQHSFGAAQPSAVDLIGLGSAAPLSYALYCSLRGVAADSAAALMEYTTLMVHVRALALAALVLLATNLALTAALVAAMSGRLWSPHLAASPRAGEPAGPAAGRALV